MARMGSYLHWGPSHTTRVTVETTCNRKPKTPFLLIGITAAAVTANAVAYVLGIFSPYTPIIAWAIAGAIVVYGITKAILEIKQRPARIRLQEQINRSRLLSESSQVGLPKRSTIRVEAERLPTQLKR